MATRLEDEEGEKRRVYMERGKEEEDAKAGCRAAAFLTTSIGWVHTIRLMNTLTKLRSEHPFHWDWSLELLLSTARRRGTDGLNGLGWFLYWS